MKKTVLLLASIFLLTGCNKSTKKNLGLIETMPDEYKVKRNKSLEIPPNYQSKKSITTKENIKLSKAEQALLKEVN